MDRIEEIKRRHRERKTKISLKEPGSHQPRSRDHFDDFHGTSSSAGSSSPSKKTSFFIMKSLIAAVLVLGVGIVEKDGALPFPQAKKVVQTAFTNEFNFARVSSWYQQAFGSPLAILPFGKSSKSIQPTSSNVTKTASTQKFAVPVSGQITQTFSQSKKGVTVQTALNSPVDSIDSGYVLSITNDRQTGKTVIIQHTNGDQSIYGDLKSVDVKVYDFVNKKQKLGTVSAQNNQGVFYFAFKKGNQYVDPIQVISFD